MVWGAEGGPGQPLGTVAVGPASVRSPGERLTGTPLPTLAGGRPRPRARWVLLPLVSQRPRPRASRGGAQRDSGGLWRRRWLLLPPGRGGQHLHSPCPRAGVRPRRTWGSCRHPRPAPRLACRGCCAPRPGLLRAGGAGLAGAKRPVTDVFCKCPGDTGAQGQGRGAPGLPGRLSSAALGQRGAGTAGAEGPGGAVGFVSQQEPGPGSHP